MLSQLTGEVEENLPTIPVTQSALNSFANGSETQNSSRGRSEERRVGERVYPLV